MSPFDSLPAMMPTVAGMSVTVGGDPSRRGDRHALSAPFGVYEARGGHFAPVVLDDRLFGTQAGTVDAPAPTEDLRLASDALRSGARRFSMESAHAKLSATEAAREIADEALRIHGGHGCTRDFPLERCLRGLRIFRTYEGSSEIQRTIIEREPPATS